MKPCLIIKTGEKIPSLADIPGDYEEWIAAGMGFPPDKVVVSAPYRGEHLPHVTEICGAVVTGSGAMVTDSEPWMEESATWLREAVDRGLPLLGICFGHQLLAHALGGEVAYNPAGVEVGSIAVTLTPQGLNDLLLGPLPLTFSAQLSHRQSVRRLPPGAVPLATSAMEPHQAFAYGTHAWGVQFHPEFDATIIRRFIENYRPLLDEAGRNADSLIAASCPTPEAHALLARFAHLLRGGSR